jgi:dephospho-CoA kinase
MLVLGITGGIGSGKGVATEFFRSRGAAIVDADEVAGELTKPGAALTARIISEFGCEFALDSGGLDRRRLAARVFRDARATGRLNKITHPPIMSAVAAKLAELQTEGRTSIACVVAPLLLEAGWARGRGVDRVLLMVADDEERVRRVVARDGLSAAEVRLRMAQQMPAEKQRRQADWVVDTTADRAEVLRQLASVWEELNRLSARLIG